MSASSVLALLELLQTQPDLTGAQLAARLEIDPRTVRRQITTLEGLGVPVIGDRGATAATGCCPGTSCHR